MKGEEGVCGTTHVRCAADVRPGVYEPLRRLRGPGRRRHEKRRLPLRSLRVHRRRRVAARQKSRDVCSPPEQRRGVEGRPALRRQAWRRRRRGSASLLVGLRVRQLGWVQGQGGRLTDAQDRNRAGAVPHLQRKIRTHAPQVNRA